MALLIIAMGVIYPSLSRFFRGRHIEGEARRLLGLTRFAQSQAISMGIPVQIWIDLSTASYGVQVSPGFLDHDPFPQVYTLERNMQMELSSDTTYLNAQLLNTPPGVPIYSSPLPDAPLGTLNNNATSLSTSLSATQPYIAFRPDGSVSQSSPSQILLRDRETDEELWIVRNPIRLNYEIVRPSSQ